MRSAGPLWWLYAWLVFISFQLLMLAIYPTFIAPIFNKFSPLDAGDTRSAIEALLKRTEFTSNGLFVMDGSKRSAHGNAYFTGFGRAKRIVFFDTLLERLSTSEIVAVLAHELGHFKRKHIVKRIMFVALANLAFMAALAWVLPQPWLTLVWLPAGYGCCLTRCRPAAVFARAAAAALFWVAPLASAYSRKHEFEADSYAAEVAKPRRPDCRTDQTLQPPGGQRQHTTPDPIYSAYHHCIRRR